MTPHRVVADILRNDGIFDSYKQLGTRVDLYNTQINLINFCQDNKIKE